METTDLPDIRILGERRPYAMKEHHLPCGHVIPVGERYSRTTLLVDGEFQFNKECTRCLMEAILEGE